jgi:uncharacterized damage-inducible protein DinB
MSDRFRRWYEYECDAQRRVFESLESVPAARRSLPEYVRAVSLAGHLVAARRLWLARLGQVPMPADPLFPEESDLGPVRAASSAVEAEWTRYLAAIDDDALARDLTYRSYEGEPFESRVEDILTQLFGHSSYHRGQIAMLVRQAGGAPAKTDFIFWTRKPAPEPA